MLGKIVFDTDIPFMINKDNLSRKSRFKSSQ